MSTLRLNNGAINILGLDPGGTTGYAFYQAEVITDSSGKPEYYDEKWNTGQMGGPHHLNLYDFLCRMQCTNFIVVCESFEYRRNPQDSQRDNIVLDSKEYIGVVKLFEQSRMAEAVTGGHGVQRVVFQTAAEGKGFWYPRQGGKRDPSKLKKIGLYNSGSIHMNDATAHILHYMTFKMGRKDLLDKLK